MYFVTKRMNNRTNKISSVYLSDFFCCSVSDKFNVYSCVWTTDLAAVLFVFTLHNNLMKQTLTRTVYWTQFETKKKPPTERKSNRSIFQSLKLNNSIYYMIPIAITCNCQTRAKKKYEFNFVERLFSVIRKFYRIFCHEASVPQSTVHFSQTHRIRAETTAIYFWCFVQRDECSKTECFRSKSPNFIVQFSCELNIQWELWFSLFRIRWLSFSVPTLSSLECLLSLG